MLPSFIYVGLILLQICTNVEAKLRYALIFPSTMYFNRENHICLHLEDMKGDSNVMITLTIGRKTTPLLTKLFQESSSFSCNSFQIPNELDIIRQTGTLFLSIQTADELIHENRRVDIEKKRKMDAQILIQTDKPLYKPGQTVKFRIVSLNSNFQPEDMELPLVELQDPGKNRIGQMLNVSLTQGIADLSFSLSPEPLLGTYSIRVKNKVHTFQVEEYVLPKFEVILELPNSILKSMQTFPVKTCGRYTYGKPVQGTYTGSLCQKFANPPYFVPFSPVRSPGNCINFEGKLDHLGCSSNTMRSSSFQLSSDMYTTAPIKLEGTVTIREEGTGILFSTTSETSIVDSYRVSFLDPRSTYKPGMPYTVTIEVTDSKNSPVPGQKVYLTCEQCDGTINETLVTDDNGHASCILENTTNWTQQIGLKASTTREPESRSRLYIWNPNDARLTIVPLYSSSKSYLNLKSLGKVNSCRSQQEVLVQYIIRNSALQKDTKQMDLYYLVTSKGHIELSRSQKIMVKSSVTDLQGDLSFNFSVNVSDSSFIYVLAYFFLPSGEMVADSLKIKMMRCLKNKVSVGFSADEVLPGSDVSLKVQTAPGSLCGLRVVDKSVVLMKPENELTAEKVYDLFTDSQRPSLFGISVSSDMVLVPCENGPAGSYYFSPFSSMSMEEDLDKLFVDMQLKVITSAEVKKPVHCPDPNARVGYGVPFGGFGGVMPVGMPASAGAAPGIGSVGLAGTSAAGIGALPQLGNAILDPLERVGVTRKYFPETWIWELTPIGNSGVVELQHLSPDTITDWTAGAICMGPDGFGLSPSVPLRVFQPYFVELALPYSVIRGETFTLKANVFNYLKQCIKVQTTLLPSLELELEACPQCQYSSCLCADESKIFSWNVKAAKLGEVNITVRTEAVNTPDLCNNEVPLVPKQGNVDTVIKPLIVKPGGVLVEKSHSVMICTQAVQGNSKTEKISLTLPVNILKDSERAYVTVVGDMMGTTLEHLDHLLTMPFGCGEQNMVRFAPNIFVLQYLEKTNQLSSEIKSKATNFMKNGYQVQLRYKRDDGSYSAYGKDDPEGNMWLTAFVLKTFSKSKPHIFIDEAQLNASYVWLTRNRFYSGCFRKVGKLFQTSMKMVSTHSRGQYSAILSPEQSEAGVHSDYSYENRFITQNLLEEGNSASGRRSSSSHQSVTDTDRLQAEWAVGNPVATEPLEQWNSDVAIVEDPQDSDVEFVEPDYNPLTRAIPNAPKRWGASLSTRLWNRKDVKLGCRRLQLEKENSPIRKRPSTSTPFNSPISELHYTAHTSAKVSPVRLQFEGENSPIRRRPSSEMSVNSAFSVDQHPGDTFTEDRHSRVLQQRNYGFENRTDVRPEPLSHARVADCGESDAPTVHPGNTESSSPKNIRLCQATEFANNNAEAASAKSADALAPKKRAVSRRRVSKKQTDAGCSHYTPTPVWTAEHAKMFLDMSAQYVHNKLSQNRLKSFCDTYERLISACPTPDIIAELCDFKQNYANV